MKQGNMRLEDFWLILQGVWGEIDRRESNPMSYSVDIAKFNTIKQGQKLFQFLNAIENKYNQVKEKY